MNETKLSAAETSETLRVVRALGRRQVREANNCLWLEGVRNFIQACDVGFHFETVVLSPVLLKNHLAEMLVRRLAAQGIRKVKVSPEQFRSVSTTERASGIGAIVQQRWLPLKRADPTQGLCWLIVEHIRSPGNLGTILRTAEACGVGGVIFVGPRSDPFDPAVLRGSMGGIFHLPLVRTTHELFRDWVRRQSLALVGLSPEATQLWTELPKAPAIGLVLGEERGGLSEAMRELCKETVRLPMTGRADSLNVGVAAGVVLYELVRRSMQR